MLVYLNDKFINENKATVSVNNRSFRYGDGCFETIKLINGSVVLAHMHMERLFSTLQALQFECPSFFKAEYLLNKIAELAAKNEHQSMARIRLTIFRGDGGLYDTQSMWPNLLIQSWPLNEETNHFNENGLVIDVFEKGHKACDAFANLKSNNYLLYAMAAMYAKQQHCNDVLVLNQFGRIADATIANVFLLENETLITPPLSEGPVNGVMRRYLLENVASLGIASKEEPITIDRLLHADEVFLTNAIYGAKWVKQFGNRLYANKTISTIHQQLLLPLWK